ncbi:MAG: DUF3857 domain-containing protein [Chitinophagaceae bacterium]|nr:DUF3857 domain-containing protein [Chitinophagaceae bacterium]
MKQIISFTAIILAFFLSATAQEFPNFGRISNDEFNLKECAFDKEANAVILLNEAIATHDDEYHLITTHHVRIKILSEKGFDEANIELKYWRKDDFEFLDQLEAIVTNKNTDGNITTEKLPKKAFYKKDLNERIGLVIFTFPNIRVGSIIEYSYRSFMKNYNGLDDWEFQKDLPVYKSSYALTILPTTEFTYRIQKREDLPVILNVDKESAKIYLEMNNVPSLTSEPYMDAREDYVQKAIFQLSGYNNGYGKLNYMTSWKEVIKELLDDKVFGVQLGKNIPGTKAVIDEIKKLPTEDDKIKAVYNYVRNSMTWNGFYGKYAIDGIKEAWDKKKGTSGEINLILINLLKETGLEVYPILVSERFHGKVNSDYPFIDQFNSVFAYVNSNGKKYFLDATDNQTPSHIIPKDILNTTALIVHKKNGGLINIVNETLQYTDYINAQLDLNDNAGLSGEVLIQNSGYSKIEKASAYKKEGQEKYISNQFGENGISFKDFEFLNINNDTLPLEQKFKFTTTLSGNGNYLTIPLNLFSGFENNPFINDNRFSNINFGYKRTINTYTSISLPKNFILDELPKPVRMTTPDNDILFTRTISYDKETNTITCLLLIDFKKSLYSAEDYPILQEIYKRMFEYLKEPVVLKKK